MVSVSSTTSILIPTVRKMCSNHLDEMSLASLQSAIACSSKMNGKNARERQLQIVAYMKMVSFCDEKLQGSAMTENKDELSSSDASQYTDLVIRHLLKAMNLNSRNARLRFPRLLQLIQVYPDTRDLFKAKVFNISIRMISIGVLSFRMNMTKKISFFCFHILNPLFTFRSFRLLS